MNNRASSLYMRMVCTAVFCTFSLVYLYCYQPDILFRLQHAASDGKTHYIPVIGAILITVVAKLLQVVVYGVSRLYKRGHALTYLPSCMMLTFLTSLDVDKNGNIDLGEWWWLAPSLLILYIVVVWIVHDNQGIEPVERSSCLASQLIWLNLIQLILMFLVVISVSIHDERSHIEAHIQRIVYDNVRSFAMNRETDNKETETEEKEKNRNKEVTVVENVDSTLCMMLMNKNLNGFAKKIKRSYDLSKAIPYVYAEALQLYMRQPSHSYYWNNAQLSHRLDSFLKEKDRVGTTKNRNAFIKHFGDSYWMYYYY